VVLGHVRGRALDDPSKGVDGAPTRGVAVRARRRLGSRLDGHVDPDVLLEVDRPVQPQDATAFVDRGTLIVMTSPTSPPLYAMTNTCPAFLCERHGLVTGCATGLLLNHRRQGSSRPRGTSPLPLIALDLPPMAPLGRTPSPAKEFEDHVHRDEE
jgi:hypothetical protein